MCCVTALRITNEYQASKVVTTALNVMEIGSILIPSDYDILNAMKV